MPISETFFQSTTVRAINPQVTFDGPFPKASRDYYALAPGGHRRAYVYLLFDAADRLLYVGRARQPGNRFDKHRRQKPWWSDVSRLVLLEVVGHDRAEAHAVVDRLDRLAIRQLHPIHNIAGVLA